MSDEDEPQATSAALLAALDDEIEQAIERRLELITRDPALLERRRGPREPSRLVAPILEEVDKACRLAVSPPSVAYLGPAGSYAHAATLRLFGKGLDPRPEATISQVYDAVVRRQVDHGVVPIENSTEGSVRDSLDRLVSSRLSIEREAVVDVEHCLLSRAPRLDAVEAVISHPQALAQCRDWLARHLPDVEQRACSSTSLAVLRARDDAKLAAISGRLAGELYGVAALAEAIQDVSPNVTRFIVVGREELPPTGRDRTSVVFSTRHEQGALRKALEVFDSAGLNLTRIESRPSRERLWEYLFFVDFEGHRTDPVIASALASLAAATGMVRLLGSYPRSD